MECYINDISNYLKFYNKEVVYSNTIIQHPLSFHCGFFCIGCILTLESGYDLSDYLAMFRRSNLLDNDVIVQKFIVQLIK